MTADLDDPRALAEADPAGMLLAVASSAAQVRESAALARESALESLRELPRPRAVVTVGMGGSGIAGDALAAVAGPGCPVPVIAHKGYGLPGWIGAADVVLAVSCSGSTEETLSAFDEATRRGCPTVAVGAADSALAQRAERANAPFVPVRGGRQPRASMWALTVPLLVAAGPLGLGEVAAADLEEAAQRLEQIAEMCRPDRESFVNPAKELALSLVDRLALVWGCSPLAAAAGLRFGCQLNENAKTPAVTGALPEANHNQVVAFDGPFGRGAAGSLFDDPGQRAVGLRLVLLRDSEEHPQVSRRAEVSRELAEQRGVAVHEVRAEGRSRVERLASLVGLLDYASVYLGLALGLDPTPVEAIGDLKARIA